MFLHRLQRKRGPRRLFTPTVRHSGGAASSPTPLPSVPHPPLHVVHAGVGKWGALARSPLRTQWPASAGNGHQSPRPPSESSAFGISFRRQTKEAAVRRSQGLPQKSIMVGKIRKTNKRKVWGSNQEECWKARNGEKEKTVPPLPPNAEASLDILGKA